MLSQSFSTFLHKMAFYYGGGKGSKRGKNILIIMETYFDRQTTQLV